MWLSSWAEVSLSRTCAGPTNCSKRCTASYKPAEAAFTAGRSDEGAGVSERSQLDRANCCRTEKRVNRTNHQIPIAVRIAYNQAIPNFPSVNPAAAGRVVTKGNATVPARPVIASNIEKTRTEILAQNRSRNNPREVTIPQIAPTSKTKIAMAIPLKTRGSFRSGLDLRAIRTAKADASPRPRESKDPSKETVAAIVTEADRLIRLPRRDPRLEPSFRGSATVRE